MIPFCSTTLLKSVPTFGTLQVFASKMYQHNVDRAINIHILFNKSLLYKIAVL